MFSGFVERWPMQWAENGLFSEVVPDVVDAFGYLSQTILKPPFFLDTFAMGPRFLYALNDPANSRQVADVSAQLPPAQIADGLYGGGALTLGSSVSATDTANGTFLGYAGPVATFANVSSADVACPATYIDLTTAGVNGPAPGATGWTRMIAFRVTAPPAVADGALWAWNNAQFSAPFGGSVGFFIDFANGTGPGYLSFRFGTSALLIHLVSPSSVCDGNWHLATVSFDSTGTQYTFSYDGQQSGLSTMAPGQSINQPNVMADSIGAALYPGSNYVESPFAGDVGAVAEFPFMLSADQVSTLFFSWRKCWAWENSGSRYQRILEWAGYKGASQIDYGATKRMGPASDLVPQTAQGGNIVTSGMDALTALNNVVITENGNHYVDANGTLVFSARTDRFGPFKPVVTFGENVAGGEIPYEDVAFDADTTQVGNDVQITQYGTNQVFLAESAASQAQYGTRTLQRTVNTDSAQECIDASNYYLYRYSQADPRVSKIKIHPSALVGSGVPNAWPAMLGLELGAPVTVNRRPPGWGTTTAPDITWNGFVEKIEWSMDDNSVAYCDLELSPADRLQFWYVAALHTTLAAQGAAGAATITVNPLPDSATNPFSGSVPLGMKLTLEPGTARAETLTVQSVSATTPGYASCAVTFTAAMAFTHAAGSIVCEPLPTGTNDPTTWDASATLGSTTTPAY